MTRETSDVAVVREFEEFQKYIKDDVRYKMPESEFKQRFLPLVVREHEDLVHVWRMLAGDLRYSIDVVDDVSKNTLFTLPPFLTGLTTVLNNGIEGGLSSLWDHIDQLNKTSPGQAYLEFELSLKSAAGGNDPTQVISDFLVWYYVMRRYNVVIPRFAESMEHLDQIWATVHGKPLVFDGTPGAVTTSTSGASHAVVKDKDFEEL